MVAIPSITPPPSTTTYLLISHPLDYSPLPDVLVSTLSYLYHIGLDPSSLTASIDYMGHRNTTAIAIETASNPYFTDVLVSLAGISMVGPRDYRTAIMASDFFVKLSGIYGLPHATAVSLCRSLVFIHSLLWGLCYTAAILLWRFHPSMFVTSSSSR